MRKNMAKKSENCENYLLLEARVKGERSDSGFVTSKDANESARSGSIHFNEMVTAEEEIPNGKERVRARGRDKVREEPRFSPETQAIREDILKRKTNIKFKIKSKRKRRKG